MGVNWHRRNAVGTAMSRMLIHAHDTVQKVRAARSAQNVVSFKLAADGLRPFQKNEGPPYE
jgi:hypothetical protein